ncbi:PIN domain-containing protein [Candidatus Saccharibacteria bacterium]|nr:PIN domain-containing protein [Candidatus Saccharibacteria bacterium]
MVYRESLDANVLLRLVLNDVPIQTEKVIKLLERKNASYDVSDLAIHELAYVLEMALGLSRDFVAQTIDIIISTHNINCNRTLFGEVLPAYLKYPKLSFNDCCLAGYAKLNQTEPLWTFDHTLAVQSGIAKEIK